MHIYYNSRSRNLRALTYEQRHNIKQILSNPDELSSRDSEVKYRLKRGGQTLPLLSFRNGIGDERLTQRVLYTYWQQNCLIIDYVISHDYHKSVAMDRNYMLNFLASLQENGFMIEDISEEEETCSKADFSISTFNNQNDDWHPLCFNHQNDFFLPTEKQVELAMGQTNYPMIIEGGAGTGKTVSLTLIYEFLAAQQINNIAFEEKEEVFYLYPKNAERLGAKMEQNWERSHLIGDQKLNHMIFKTRGVDALLPEALQTEQLTSLKNHMQELFQKKASSIAAALSQHKGENSTLAAAWNRVINSKISSDIMLEYFLIIAVFDAYLPVTRPALEHMLSQRGGISKEQLQDFETIYVKFKERPWFTPVLHALEKKPLFDMLVIDEAQNISFPALAYLIFNTKNHKVVCSGDRNQLSEWNSISSLKMIGQLLKNSNITTRYEILENHYRCPEEIWQYTQKVLLPFKNSLFGSEYYRAHTPKLNKSVSNHILSCVQDCSKNKSLLKDIFENIEAMAADCFIVTHDIEKFKRFSKEYLQEKEFIILKPEQIAGLEVKTVIAFDLVDWKKINKIEKNQNSQGYKIKSRLTNLEEEAQQGHDELNHLYIALTRSTENAIIIESQDYSRYDACQLLLQHLPPPQAHTGQVYNAATPQQLLEIYESLGDPQSKSAQDFYMRNGHHFSHLLKPAAPLVLSKNETVSMTSKITSNPPPVIPQDVESILTFLGQKSDHHWADIKGLDCSLLARVLFTPYGKRGGKKSFFERLKENALRNITSSTEQKIWAKLLGSTAHELILSDEFYSLSLPEKNISIRQYIDELDKTSYSVSYLINQLTTPVVKSATPASQSEKNNASSSIKSEIKTTSKKKSSSTITSHSDVIRTELAFQARLKFRLEERIEAEIKDELMKITQIFVTDDFSVLDPTRENPNQAHFKELYKKLKERYIPRMRVLRGNDEYHEIVIHNYMTQSLGDLVETNTKFWWGPLEAKFDFIKDITENPFFFRKKNRLIKAATLIKNSIDTKTNGYSVERAPTLLKEFMLLVCSSLRPFEKNHPDYEAVLVTFYNFDEDLFVHFVNYYEPAHVKNLIVSDPFWTNNTPEENKNYIFKHINKLKNCNSVASSILKLLLVHVATILKIDLTNQSEQEKSSSPLFKK